MADPAAVRGSGAETVFEGDPPGGPAGIGSYESGAWGDVLARWWPLAALTLLAAALRLSTLDLQSFWYDEAFTPVHVLHPSFAATLRSVVHTENSPPLWYVLIWGWSRAFGIGEVALRLPSALAGVATVPVAWGIGRELAGRRAAIVTAALVATSPLFVWYSQEARVYALFVFTAALAMLCFLRADREPTPRRLAAFAASGALALATHYFAVFLLLGMCLWLARRCWSISDRRSRATLAAVGALGAVGLALAPLAVAQGGHGTQWIGRWALSERLEAIPQYYLTGYSGAPLGHGVELLVALAILAGVGFGLWRTLTPRESDGALLALAIAACGIAIPVMLALFGADYLAPRNLVAAMIPATATIAVIVAARRTGRTGMILAGLIALAFLALSIDVDLSPRLQRGDWRGLARALSAASQAPGVGGRLTPGGVSSGRRSAGVITTVELGAAPLEYYLPPLHNLARGGAVSVSEIDETGYEPLRPGAGGTPAPGFRLVGRTDVHGLILYRFVSPIPRTVSEAALRAHVITDAHPEVLVGGHGNSNVGAP
jgi:mannosyltransferase